MKQIDCKKVSIIILSWNGLNDTIECLKSVKKIDYPNYETIVVDNGSTDGSQEKIKKLFSEVTLLCNGENLGFAGGNNVGIRHAMKNGAQYIWLLNNDTVVESDTLCKLVSVGEKLPQLGLLSPVIYHYSDPSKIQYCGSFFNFDDFSYTNIKNLDEIKAIPKMNSFLWGTALLIKRKVIENIGYLNEKYFAYHEDAEYSMRALRVGYLNKVEVSSKIFHKNYGANERGFINFAQHYFFYMTRNKYWLWKDIINGKLRKALFLRRYLVSTIKSIGSYKKLRHYEIADAYIDGMYCALRDIGGYWDKNIKMPALFKKIIYWHTYFWADLLGGNFKKIMVESFYRLKKQLFKRIYLNNGGN